MTETYPGWETDDLGNQYLTVVIAGERIRLATVRCDIAAGLWTTYIGLPVSGNQLGLHDASEERAVRKAEAFLRDKLRRLL